MSKFTILVPVRMPGAVRISEVHQVPLLEVLRPMLSDDVLQAYLRDHDPQLLDCIRQALTRKGELVALDLVRFSEYLSFTDQAIGGSGLGELFSHWRDAIYATGFTGIPDILANARRLNDEFVRDELARRGTEMATAESSARGRAGLPRYNFTPPQAA